MRTALAAVFLSLTIASPANAEGDPRGEERTYASYPEWYIVYSAQEYASYVEAGGLPSGFPYFGATRQYWDSVSSAEEALGGAELDSNTRTVLRFIGASFTAENALIGAYEKSVGRLSELLNFNYKTAEDRYADVVAREYADFLLHTPWYAFPYFEKLGGLWRTWGWSSISPRGIERRVIFTLGYGVKGAYGAGMGYLSRSTLGSAGLTTSFTAEGMAPDELGRIEGVEAAASSTGVAAKAPRYRAFLPVAEYVAARGGSFVDIQGHDRIMATYVAGESCEPLAERELFSQEILTRPGEKRVALDIPVAELASAIRALVSCGIRLEHLYDY